MGGEERNWAPVPQAAPSRSQEALVAPAASLWGGAVGLVTVLWALILLYSFLDSGRGCGVGDIVT